MKRRAFTLVEMLTVIAITAILMGIIIIPLIQSFNLTRAAQGFSDAQDKARLLIERLSREVSNSAGVRDNDQLRGAIGIRVPGRPTNLGGTNNGNPEFVLLDYAKLDFWQPAQGDPSRFGNGAFENPDTGRFDPTLKAPRGQVILPVAPGSTMVRYWIGLRQPLIGDNPQLYNNPYDGLLMRRSGDRDNLYVLFRAEIQPYIYQGGSFVVNTRFFRDADNDNKPDDIDDPWFFTQDGPNDLAGDRVNKAARMRNWLKASTIVTEFARYDMIQPIYTKTNRQVTYDGNVPRIIPLVQFRPTRVSAEPAKGQQAVRVGEETDNAGQVSPDAFETQYGSWANALVRAYPTGWQAGVPGSNDYVIGRYVEDTNGRRFRIYRYDPDNDPDGDDTNGEGNPADDVEMFDATTYEEFLSSGRVYAFTRGVLDANSRSNWLANANNRSWFIPFLPDGTTGKVLASFPITEVGVDVPAGGVRRPDNNLPTVATGAATTPLTDPTPPGTFADYTNDINRRFNKVWADQPNLRPNIHRFIDLRVAPCADGASGPLHPVTGFPRIQVVPGSEIVYGPDQNPGPNYGQAIRYLRTTRDPGPNQYRINYVDLPEPTDYPGLLGVPAPPAVYDANDFTSAIVQPRFKAGYLQFNSDVNTPLPQGNISVYYRFQMTRPNDTFAVDYDTRRVLTIRLTVRNYPQTTVPNPQDVTLSGTATVRNYVR